jgi:hypothetical protein
MKAPQTQQRQDGEQVQRAFCKEAHGELSIDNAAVSSIAPRSANPREK